MSPELIALAIASSAAIVNVLTEILKLVPVKFTSRYPAWVNGILSVIAAIIVIHPAVNVQDIGATLGTALFIAVAAAVAYNQYTSKLVNLGGPKV